MFDDDIVAEYIRMLEDIKEDYITFAGGDINAGRDIQNLIIWIKDLVSYVDELEKQI